MTIGSVTLLTSPTLLYLQYAPKETDILDFCMDALVCL